MSLTLAISLVAAVYLSFRIGCHRGRNEMAAEVIREFAPLLPLLRELSEMAESLGVELGGEGALERLNAMRKAGQWN